MRVLLVDDDRTVRFLLKVMLVRSLDCVVQEAENGLQALEQLAPGAWDLVLLDLDMPVVDGLQTLRAIRSSPDHAALPVAIISSDRQDTLVRECIALGIDDYITKPFSAEQIRNRLARFRTGPRARAAAAPPVPAPCVRARAALHPGDRLVVADGSDDYRRFLSSVLEPRFAVSCAPSGAQALKLVIETRPSALLVGTGLGVLGGHQLMMLSRQTAGRDLACVALLPRTAGVDARSGFDGVITRGSERDGFLAEFDALFCPEAAVDTSFARRLDAQLVAALDQFCGMVLGVDAAPVDEVPACREDECLATRVGLTGDGPGFELELRADRASAARMHELAVSDASRPAVSDEDRMAVLAEAANIVGGRLRHCLLEHGLATELGLPLRTTEAGGPPEPGASEVYVRSDSGRMAIRARLSMRVATAAPAGTGRLRGGQMT